MDVKRRGKHPLGRIGLLVGAATMAVTPAYAASPTTAPLAELPAGFGVGSPQSLGTTRQIYADLNYLRRALAEVPVEGSAGRRATELVTAAEAAAKVLAINADRTPATAPAVDRQAVDLRAKFDRQVAAAIPPRDVTAWARQAKVLFVQEFITAGASGSDYTIDDMLAQVGVTPSPAQSTRAAAIIAKLRAERRLVEEAPAKSLAAAFNQPNPVAVARIEIRNILTTEQLAAADAATLRWLDEQANEGERQDAPATRP